MKMKRFRLIGVALLAVFALGAVVASGAQAQSAPFFSIGGTRLAAGKTRNIVAHGTKPFELRAPAQGTNIKCENLTVEKGVLLGSEAGSEGKADFTNKYENCALTEGNGAPNCHLGETASGKETKTIRTNPLHGELVENVEGSKGGKKLEELYTPASGKQFVTINFEGTGCTLFSTIVTGSTAAELVTDPGEASIELPGPTPEATSFITRFPATTIKQVWLVSGGTGKIVEVEEVYFGDITEPVGTALVSLEVSAKWSPLP